MIIFTVVAILFLIATFLTHYFYEEYLWFKSVETWVPWFQSFSWWPWKRFVRILYWFGWELLWLGVIAFYSKFNRASSYYLISTMCVIVWMVAVFKMYWNDPAPYMDRKYIDAFECDQNTFMTPSLEVTISAFAYSMMFYLAFDWIEIRRPKVKLNRPNPAGGARDTQNLFEEQEPEFFLHDATTYMKDKNNDFKFWVYLSLVFYLVFLIAYAGMYIGAQTLDQVLFAMCLGYGFFCILYYFHKDSACERIVKVSEKMLPNSKTLGYFLIHLIFMGVLLIIARVFYHFQIKDFTVNPGWKSEHYDQCGLLTFPSFFDKEMLYAYNFAYLFFGIALGLTFDSIVLGGTRVDYNQVRESEDRKPFIAFIIRFLVTIVWVLLCLWGGIALLKLLVHRWLFILAIPYFVCGFGLFSIIKYVFKLLHASRPEINPIPDVAAVELRTADRPPVNAR